MSAAASPASATVPPPLAGAFASRPAPDGIRPTEATRALVASQVQALLDATDSYHALPLSGRRQMADRLTHIAAYAAECVRDICWQSEQLGQRPVMRQREVLQGPVARAAAAPGQPGGAVSQVARVTKETLRAIAFPTFVADLIKGTFNAIIQSNIQQLEQFGRLLENVTKSVDEFMNDNISDDQARDWLQQRFPDQIKVKDGKATAADGADEKPAPNWEEELHLTASVSLDDDTIEETLVPAARRRLAENRLQMLSTMVLMGVNRIVVTGGKIRATMGFHIDASERAHEEHATDADFRTAAAGSFGWGPWSVSASTSFSYVTSTRANSDSEINVSTDLTGEVEIHFKSDYFPVERFAQAGTVSKIQGNTPNPEANPLGETPPVGQTVQPPSRPSHPKPVNTLPPIGTPLPEAKAPVKPTKPEVERHVDAPKGSKWAEPSKSGDSGEASPPTDAKPPDDSQKKSPPEKKDAKAGDAKPKKEDAAGAAPSPAPADSDSGVTGSGQSYWQEVFQ